MAQEHLDKEMYKLSNNMGVHVSSQGQVEFIVIPDLKVMKPSVVVISGKAWNSLCSEGMERVNTCLMEMKEEQWMYHPHTKFIHVKKNFNGWQVVLQTYTRKGAEMKAHTVILEVSEWDKLCSQADKITLRLVETQQSLGVKNRGYIKMFRVEMGAQWGERSQIWYYLKEHAEDKARELTDELTDGGIKAKVVEEMREKPRPYDFIRLLYLILFYRVGHFVNQYNCWGCRSGGKFELHERDDGCQYSKRKIYSDYYKVIDEILSDERVLSVYRKCLDILDIGEPKDAVETVKFVKGLLKKSRAKICEEMMQLGGLCVDELPEALLVDLACDEIWFNENMKEYLDDRDSSSSEEEEEIVYSPEGKTGETCGKEKMDCEDDSIKSLAIDEGDGPDPKVDEEKVALKRNMGEAEEAPSSKKIKMEA